MELYPFQKIGITQGKSRGSSIFLCDEMGLGKTPQALHIVNDKNLYPLIIVCPAVLKINWLRELERWIGKTTVIDDYSQEIIITNYERLEKLLMSNAHWKAQSIIFDESHYLKNSKSERTIIAKEIAKRIPYKILISGTPIPNHVREIVPQLEILQFISNDVEKLKFYQRYCPVKKVPYGNPAFAEELPFRLSYDSETHVDELYKKLSKIWIRRTKNQIRLNLPPMRTAFVPICNFPQNDPTSFEDIQRCDKAVLGKKLPRVIEWVENFTSGGEPIVLFAHHKRVIRALVNRFPHSAVVVGGQTPKERQQNIDDFQHKRTQIILCSMTASNVGLTLTSASNCAFLELPWTPSMLEQAMARIHRISQTQPCTTYILYAENSIDEYRMRTMYNKNATIGLVTDG